MDKILVTGGAGFIGSHIVDELIEEGHEVTVLDRLSTGGSLMNINDDATFIREDVRNDILSVVEDHDAVIHAAAESHVDRSISFSRDFIESNVVGTQSVLDAVAVTGVRLLMISTDEVYGHRLLDDAPFLEGDMVKPRSPYAASKAAADLLCQSYITTFGINASIVRGTNAYGPRQVEKVIPTYSLSAINGRSIPVYGKGEQRREFLHVQDWVKAAYAVLRIGEPGEIYNIGGGHEIPNIDLAKKICGLVGADESLITFVPDRLGHDFRYGVNCDKLRALGWRPHISFEQGLNNTITWYVTNRTWLKDAHPYLSNVIF